MSTFSGPDIGATFRALHRPGAPFVLANAWDVGSARVLVALGAKAIGTSSGAQAITLGRPDMGTISRDEALSHAQDIVANVSVPVSGDFENGYGDDPETCAETVRLAAEIGLAGICIEDMYLPEATAYDHALAVERIKAAASAARALPKDFFLVARADGVMNQQYDMAEAQARSLAFEQAGADGLYVPLPPSLPDLAELCSVASVPVNALAAGPFARVSQANFAAAGVARISLGSALSRRVMATLLQVGQQILTDGDFSDLIDSAPSSTLIDAFDKGQQ